MLGDKTSKQGGLYLTCFLCVSECVWSLVLWWLILYRDSSLNIYKGYLWNTMNHWYYQVLDKYVNTVNPCFMAFTIINFGFTKLWICTVCMGIFWIEFCKWWVQFGGVLAKCVDACWSVTGQVSWQGSACLVHDWNHFQSCPSVFHLIIICYNWKWTQQTFQLV